MTQPDFFEENATYTNRVGTFKCISVLDEHGYRYAFGLTYSTVAPMPGGRGIPATYRFRDFAGFRKVDDAD